MKEICRKVGFFILSIFSLLYIIFSRNFAEMRVQFSFLDFPVFVGEISIIFCLILSLFVFDFRSIKGWKWGVAFYFVCVIAKALWGYSLWGPLAFRHAALFYYPIFIFFGFIFFKRIFLSKSLKIFIVLLIFALCITKYLYEYWVLTLWAIAYILIRSFRNKTIKYLFYICLLWIIFLSFKVFIMTSRTFIVGNIVATVFLLTTLLITIKMKVSYKAVIAGVLFILLTAFVYKYSSLNASGTILDIKTIISQYRINEAELKSRQPYYVPQMLSDIKLFNAEQSLSQKETPKCTRYIVSQKKKPEYKDGSFNILNNVNIVKNVKNVKMITKGRNVEGAYANTLFRLFIWRDMFFEFSRSWPILGFSFGKPFRSESLEILDWATGEWQRDGWIEPHNSYLNILYRIGILGIALIGFLIWQFCRMIKSFITLKSSVGILLCFILIIWLAAANFLPILELPYNAIPFWALWGVTLGYLKELKDEHRKTI